MKKKYSAIALVFTLLFAFLAFTTPRAAKADGISTLIADQGKTIQVTLLSSVLGQTNGTAYVGLNLMQIGSDPTNLVYWICDDPSHDVSYGQTWTVYDNPFQSGFNNGGSNNETEVEFDAAEATSFFNTDGSIDTNLQNNVDTQQDIWNNHGSGYSVDAGMIAIYTADYPLQGSINGFYLDANGLGGGGGQNGFVLAADPEPPAVPEPSSLLMLGTGILGLAGALKRRLASAGH
jgi:hypothetical protein